MLRQVSVDELSSALMKERKYVNLDVAQTEAKRYISEFDESLDAALSTYCKTGKYSEVSHGDMSILTVVAMRRCGYIEAARLLDAYIKNPDRGLALITRR